jgi:hypothetical protein
MKGKNESRTKYTYPNIGLLLLLVAPFNRKL